MSTVALSSNQQGATPVGTAIEGKYTLTPTTTATAGEVITSAFTSQFSSIHTIEIGGVSDIALFTGQIPVFQFTPGGALASNDVTIFWLDDALAIDNATDLSSSGTMQLVVTGDQA